jgi:hypothetical protein
MPGRPKKKSLTPLTYVRTAEEKMQDLADISSLIVQRMNCLEIRQWINERRKYQMSFKQVALDWEEVLNTWRDNVVKNAGEIRSRMLAHIDETEKQAWKAWHASIGCPDDMVEVEEEMDGGLNRKGQRRPSYFLRKRTKRVRQMTGLSYYMETIKWCIETRLRMYRLLDENAIGAGSDELGDSKRVFDTSVTTVIVDKTGKQIGERKLLEFPRVDENAAPSPAEQKAKG